MKIYAIKLKYMGNDINGFKKYIYATEGQKRIIEIMRNNADKRYNFVEIGGVSFSPMDVAYIEVQNKESYELPKYVIERLKIDEMKKLDSRYNKNMVSFGSENA